MFRVILFVAFTIGSVVSRAEVMEWNFESRNIYKSQLRFFSKSHGGQWPEAGKAYTLYEWRDYQYRLQCTPGEKICYGVSSYPDPKYNWGVGINNDRGCQGCCRTCGDGPVKMVLE